jgi:uncharacterized membrane protein YidH (DUF202 family)
MDASQRARSAWQYRLLPLMAGMVLLLTLYFVLENMLQIRRVEHFLGDEAPPPNAAITPPDSGFRTAASRDAVEFRARAALELRALDHRYHQSNLILMTRTWTRYMAFLTGMVLALIGAAFVLGRIEEPGSKLEAGGEKLRVNLESASPGLFLALFGTVLMGMAILTRVDVTFSDQAVYLGQRDSLVVVGQTGRPSAEPPLDLTNLHPAPSLRPKVRPPR